MLVQYTFSQTLTFHLSVSQYLKWISCRQYCWTNSFEFVPRTRTTESYDNSIFSFLRNLHTLYHSSYTNLDSHQQCTSVPVSSNPCHHLPLFIFTLIFFYNSLQTSVRRYSSVVLFCIPSWFVMLSISAYICWPVLYLLQENVYSIPLPTF